MSDTGYRQINTAQGYQGAPAYPVGAPGASGGGGGGGGVPTYGVAYTQPQMVVAIPYPGYPGPPGQPYGYAAPPPQMYAPTGPVYLPPSTGYAPLIVAPYPPRRNGYRRLGLCCFLSLGSIMLLVYFGIMRCRGGDTVAGQCPAPERLQSHALWLPQPTEPVHGTMCEEGDSRPGTCCDWRPATCLTSAGCYNKHEYSGLGSYSANCTALQGLLSCAVASPRAGVYTSAGFGIAMCPSFCNQLWGACSTRQSTQGPTDYCNGLNGITVRSTDCYSGAFPLAQVTRPWALVLLCVLAIMSLV